MKSITKHSFESLCKKFNVHQRINLRSHRNALNINHLFDTVLNDSSMGFTKQGDKGSFYPHPNNGIYHK